MPRWPRSSRRFTCSAASSRRSTRSSSSRNWPRATLGPATAIVVGSGAAVGLVLLRTQRKRHKRRAQSHGARDLAYRTLRDVAREAYKVFDELAPDR